MKNKNNRGPQFFVLITSLFLAIGLGCQHTDKSSKDSLDKTSRATAMAGGESFTEIEFEPGKDALTQSSREKLRQFSNDVTAQGREIDEIKVLAWSDRSYPTSQQKASKQDIDLADKRASNIEEFLEKDLNNRGDVDTFNMAKRPYKVSEILRTDDYETKTLFERAGVASSEGELTSDKTSKAVIFVTYE